MKIRELVKSTAKDTEFKILVSNDEMEDREVCRLDGNIFRNYTDFDWLLDKEVSEVSLARGWGYLVCYINLTERTND